VKGVIKRHMEARDEVAVNEETAEEEELDVSNLLVTKSERAPATESPPAAKRGKSKADVVKATVLGALGSVAVAAAIMLARRLIFEPRHRSEE
jgi:hypothetical protein